VVDHAEAACRAVRRPAEFLAERHSYDDPEIIATPIVAGSQSYLDWVAEETRPGD